MKYRKLGKTNLKVAEVGIGTWQLVDDEDMWVGADIKESLKSLYKYVELGGNFIDTAWIYGYDSKTGKHASEELIGKYLKESGKSDNLIIATKVAPKNMQWPAFYGTPISKVFPNKWIVDSVEDSLRSLQIDTIDLVQLHVWQDEWVKQDGWKKTIEKLTKRGKVKHWGISANDYQPSNCIKALDTGLISTVQFIFNIFHQKPTEKLLSCAKKNNIGLIARVPLDEGGLTGKFTKNTKWEKGDFRNSYFAGARLSELVKRTAKLKQIAKENGMSLTEMSLSWILSHKEVSTVIPGMRKVSYIKQNMSVAGKKLSKNLMNELKAHLWERNFYSGLDPHLKDSGYVEE